MENCTIYSHETDFTGVIDIVKRNLPKAKFELNDDGIQKQFTATVKGGLFSKDKVLRLNYRRRQEPSYTLEKIMCPMSENIAGMVRFIQTFPAQDPGIKDQLIIKVKSCNSEIAFIAEPEIISEFSIILHEIINHLDAIIFAQPNRIFHKSRTHHFVDKNANLILDQEGNSEVTSLDVRVSSAYMDPPAETYTQEQFERRQKSEKFLAENNIRINKHLPLTKDAQHTQWRTPHEISERIHALLVTAAKGEGIGQEIIDKMILSRSIHALSPRESELVTSQALSDQDKSNATWRYESLTTLLWVAGILNELPYPSEICNVEESVRLILSRSRTDFDAAMVMRTPDEILDRLDIIYLMDWACVDARLKGDEPGGNLHPGVVYERHYALNWVTNYQEQDWDEVQTTT